MKKSKISDQDRNQSPKNRTDSGPHSAPIYMTSSFTFDSAEHGQQLFADQVDGNIYTRFSNPNTSELIERMAILEQADDGFAFASGMAAIFAGFASFLKSGDHIVSSRALFGSTHQILTQILTRWGITHTYVDIDRPQDWEKAIRDNTRMLFVETPSNPGLGLVDLEFVADLKKKYDLIMNVDNTFATPFLQTPISFGADLVTHSATKYLDGQGRVIAGMIVGKKELIQEVRFFARQTGPSLSPFNAWLLTKSLETLNLRMEKTCANALRIAEFLGSQSNVTEVRYPYLPTHPQYDLAKKQMRGGGGIISFVINGGTEQAMRFLNATRMVSLTANLGDTRTILTHPASTTHSRLTEEERRKVGISAGLIRISCGIEEPEIIIDDLNQAFKRIK